MAKHCDVAAGWQHDGRGKGPQQVDAYCGKCGKYGHSGAECWSKGKGIGKEKGKGKMTGNPTWGFGQATEEGEWHEHSEQTWEEDDEAEEICGTMLDVSEVRTESHFRKITVNSGEHSSPF